MARMNGWFQVAYERDIVGNVHPVHIGDLPLILVRDAHGLRAFGATCPHRGANLGYGGTLHGNAIVCPFHGMRVALGCSGEAAFAVPAYRTLNAGGLIYVLVGEVDTGLSEEMAEIENSHSIVPGFEIEINVDPPLVVENAFDSLHFRPVHRILNEPQLEIVPSRWGEFRVHGNFEVPPSRWQQVPQGDTSACFSYEARAFSPFVVISSLRGNAPYSVLTSSTPNRSGGSIVRLSLAFPKGTDGTPPDREQSIYLLQQSLQGIRLDQQIWEQLAPQNQNQRQYCSGEETIAGFREFLRIFEGTS